MLVFGLNGGMNFVFNTVSCCDSSDIIRDEPWVKETYCVAGLPFAFWFPGLKIVEMNWDWRDTY